MNTVGRTLKIFVMGNSPNSLRTVEIVNWTGLAFLGERLHVGSIRTRPELSEPGIYLLLSDSSEAGLTDIYIGETDDFIKRIADHTQSKDWWDRFIVFVSKDRNFTKAHVKFLERELFLLAKRSIANLRVKNSQDPGGASLPESDVSSMQEFLRNIQFVLETLGLSYFTSETSTESPEVPTYSKVETDSSTLNGMEFFMALPKDSASAGKPLRAVMRVQDGVYILKAGSFIQKTARDSFAESDKSYYSLWKQIIESDAVKPSEVPTLLQTIRDIEFRAPSAAGSVVRGRSTNGRTEWKRTTDETPLSKCQAETLKKAA